MGVCNLEKEFVIIELNTVENSLEELSALLAAVVNDDASIGFLPPMSISAAKEYWSSVLTPEVILFVAKINNNIVGSVQLHLCTKQNGLHRADIAKLIVDPHFRQQGIGRALMQKALERAIKEERTLLILDTREGDPSNLLYQSLGFIEAGKIPNFAKSARGGLDTTVLYYKSL